MILNHDSRTESKIHPLSWDIQGSKADLEQRINGQSALDGAAQAGHLRVVPWLRPGSRRGSGWNPGPKPGADSLEMTLKVIIELTWETLFFVSFWGLLREDGSLRISDFQVPHLIASKYYPGLLVISIFWWLEKQDVYLLKPDVSLVWL